MSQAGTARHKKSAPPVRSCAPQRMSGEKIGTGKDKKRYPKQGNSNSISGKPSARPMSGAPQNQYPMPKSSDLRQKGSNYASARNGRKTSSMGGQQSVSKRPVKGSNSQRSTMPPAQRPPKQPLSLQRERERRRLQMKKMQQRRRINFAMLCTAACLVVVMLFSYIGRMAEVSALSKEIDRLNAEISDFKEQKQYKEFELASAQNIDRVKDEALGRLGMIVPTEEQIRYIQLNGYLK